MATVKYYSKEQFHFRQKQFECPVVHMQLRNKLLSVLKSRGVDIVHRLLLDTTSLTDIHTHQLFVRNKDLILFAVQPFPKLQADDVRIFVLNMNSNFAKEVICKVIKAFTSPLSL